jgi:tetratricopeptide (TPR) repeat protein
VTLYELLALRPAFQDDTNPEALRRDILEGRAAAVGQAHRGLSRDLITVVAHAMAPEVGRRYATARALADDLDALLALRPITARPPTATDRATSWARRNPARAIATALGATLLVGGPLVFGWQQYRANTRIRATNSELQRALQRVVEERNATEVQRAAAERNLRGAIAAVDTMLTRVGQETLRDVPQMTMVRRSLLEDALAFYEGFLAEQAGDRAMRREVVLARMRVASVRASMGETAEVERELAEVIAELQTLLSGPDAHEDLVPILARALATRGEACARLGQLAEARASVQAAIDVLGRIPADHRNAVYYTELAAHHDKLYDIAQRGGDLADALTNARRAVELSREGLAKFPDNGPLELGLGRQLDHVGGALLRSGAAEESLELMLESVRTLERYHVALPTDVQGREKLMAARVNTASTLNTLGRFQEAEHQNLAAIELGEALVDEFPDVPSYRSGFALALNQSCQYVFQRRDYPQAAVVLKRALAQQEVLAVGQPADIGLRAEMAVAYGNLSAVQLQLGEREESLQTADRGLESIGSALARVATQDQWLHVRRSLWNNRGMSLVALGRWREAVLMARTIERDLDHGWLWRRAQLLERSARLAALDTSLQDSAAEAASLRDEALADLTLAVERGLNDWSELSEPDHWASLREDPRFQALVQPSSSGR